jgi:death-on-curing protein
MLDPAFLTAEDALELLDMQLRLFGGLAGVRDRGLLESALAMPQATFGGEYLHADLFEMAAAYLYHVVLDHPFVDGNKRVGLHAAYVFLRLNGRDIVVDAAALYDLVIGVAEGRTDKATIAETFRAAAIRLP